MRRTLAIALACMAATPLAFAQAPASPARMQLAMKMYDITGAGNVFQLIENEAMGNIMGSIGQSLGDKASCPALQPEAQSFKTKMDSMFSTMSDAQFRQDAAKIYADSFTDDEMRQIIAFQQSPVGQKYQHMQPQVVNRIGTLAMTKAKVHDAEIRSAAQALSTNVQKIAATCPSAPPTAGQPPKK
ncbi:MAG TPA: DUF2059 domain-containing protein [Xanthomonadaceae bacterium]|jgi:hypothetical protein|nr:DUF2059 domain-containing protein [Xanthomonadaceae bacterium]